MICATILLQIDFVIEILKKYANDKMYRSETKITFMQNNNSCKQQKKFTYLNVSLSAWTRT